MNKKSKAGGYRVGSGRPKGTGKYGEKTCPLRIPVSLLPEIEALVASKTSLNLSAHGLAETHLAIKPFNNVFPYPSKPMPSPRQAMPLYATRVAAGAPFPVDDYIDRHLDLNQHLIEHPTATFFVRAEGDSMINAGIHENDILIVDRSIKPTHGKIIIAVVNGDLTVKRLELAQNRLRLMPENPRYQPIEITEEIDFRIWGVVLHVIHSLSK